MALEKIILQIDKNGNHTVIKTEECPMKSIIGKCPLEHRLFFPGDCDYEGLPKEYEYGKCSGPVPGTNAPKWFICYSKSKTKFRRYDLEQHKNAIKYLKYPKDLLRELKEFGLQYVRS